MTPQQPAETSGSRHGANAGFDGGDRMAVEPHAWATHAPADYMLVFVEEPDGEHAVVSARLKKEVEPSGLGLEGAELSGEELSVYCTLPGEADEVLARLEGSARKASV